MAQDSFETVAITCSQPETTVMLSMFAFYGIPAYAVGFGHARVVWPWALALGGIIIRVQADAIEEARGLLAEVATRPAAVRPRMTDDPVSRGIGYFFMLLFGVGVPTRTAATFL